MTTTTERRINIPFENRRIAISPAKTSDTRVVLIEFQNRTVYIRRD